MYLDMVHARYDYDFPYLRNKIKNNTDSFHWTGFWEFGFIDLSPPVPMTVVTLCCARKGFRLRGVWSVAETRSEIHWDCRRSSNCHVPTWPLNETYWSAWLLDVQTHKGQINSAGGDWLRRLRRRADIAGGALGANVKRRVFCDVFPAGLCGHGCHV